MTKIWEFFKGTLVLVSKGSRAYYAWMVSLLALMAVGVAAYAYQLQNGLIVTAMRDQVSWGFYISNFTFLVGVPAAAVLLVIPRTCTSGSRSRRSPSSGRCSPSPRW